MTRQLVRVSTRDMSREEWLEQRRKSIGGSDAAAIVGLSKWASPYSVWAEKTGRIPPKEDSEAMRIGRDLEDYVARRWMDETGKRVHRVLAILYNKEYPFAHADVDRLLIGENAGLECKTTSALNLRQFHNTEFPEQYYILKSADNLSPAVHKSVGLSRGAQLRGNDLAVKDSVG